ncbi:cAMP dependent protein kinase regulatory subunit [Cokeromyces recurvatus]|uniref:cAMP dependent protein kinase regulatory subunit n=1 Tax=Cokeromyces recurvatus TaxID=90255 RepID=UPI00221FB555|nr:cAMP dependent protein kinase regulatory subunit [Cokeromyces recurvatus]KAI7897685.1 cAMP dependent protein kinase regulatory subunit [Cokeromyces recurvatus]
MSDHSSHISSEKQEYLKLINELNQEVNHHLPKDMLQFCFNFFLKRLLQERSQARHVSNMNSFLFSQDNSKNPTDTTLEDTFNTTFDENINSNDQEYFVSDNSPNLNDAYLRNRRISVSAESMQPTHVKATSLTDKKRPEAKSKSEIDLIITSLKSHFFLKSIEEEQRNEIIDCMEQRRFQTGEAVIEQGDVGDFFYIVSSGTLDCFVDGMLVTNYQRGDSFGELALMHNTPRAATIKTTSETLLWALDRVSFRSILIESNAQKRIMFEKFLEGIPLFKSLKSSEIHKIADSLKPVSFRDGDFILRQGDTGDHFYLIERGEVLCYQATEDGQPQLVNKLKKGDYFGGKYIYIYYSCLELALLTDRPRAATAVAKGDLKCVTLGKAAFTRLLGPVMDILKRNTTNYHAILKEVHS